MTPPPATPPLAYALGTFSAAGSPPFPGLVVGERVLALHAARRLSREIGADLRGTASLLDLLEDWPANARALEAVLGALDATRFETLSVPVAQLRTHAPLEAPRQVFCAGANYRKHVIDLIVDQGRDPATAGLTRAQSLAYATALMDERAAHGKPYIFSRVWSSIAGPYDPIVIPANVEQPDWELELAVVIGKPAFHVTAAAAWDVVAGYTIANDVTNRELVHRADLKAIGTDWVIGKNAPGYLPMGPYLVPAAFVPNPQDVRITLALNGEIKQDESTADMIFPIPRLIEYLTSHVRLYPGDVLLTGSPSGNGSHYGRYLKPGDVMDGCIAGLGAQRNPCISAA
jgi:2-keto-4-pentenoate hydratase/2-oxohepta-3-ene-1,7-dioic acid hydratase in catechol pathway